MTIYLYARVSTKKQVEGNSLEDQAAQMLNKYPSGKVVMEQYTGAKVDRPKLQEVLSQVKPGDTLVVCKLDRLSRSVEDGLKIINDLRKKKVNIHILNMGLVDGSSMGTLMLNMLFAFAQFERDMIVERTQAGRAYAREHKHGYKEGRKTKITPQKETLVLSLLAQGYTYRQIESEYGISRGLIYKIASANRAKQITDTIDKIQEVKDDLDFDIDLDEIDEIID